MKKSAEVAVKAAHNAFQNVAAFDPNIRQSTNIHQSKIEIQLCELYYKSPQRELEEAKQHLKAIRILFNHPWQSLKLAGKNQVSGSSVTKHIILEPKIEKLL